MDLEERKRRLDELMSQPSITLAAPRARIAQTESLDSSPIPSQPQTPGIPYSQSVTEETNLSSNPVAPDDEAESDIPENDELAQDDGAMNTGATELATTAGDSSDSEHGSDSAQDDYDSSEDVEEGLENGNLDHNQKHAGTDSLGHLANVNSDAEASEDERFESRNLSHPFAAFATDRAPVGMFSEGEAQELESQPDSSTKSDDDQSDFPKIPQLDGAHDSDDEDDDDEDNDRVQSPRRVHSTRSSSRVIKRKRYGSEEEDDFDDDDRSDSGSPSEAQAQRRSSRMSTRGVGATPARAAAAPSLPVRLSLSRPPTFEATTTPPAASQQRVMTLQVASSQPSTPSSLRIAAKPIATPQFQQAPLASAPPKSILPTFVSSFVTRSPAPTQQRPVNATQPQQYSYSSPAQSNILHGQNLGATASTPARPTFFVESGTPCPGQALPQLLDRDPSVFRRGVGRSIPYRTTCCNQPPLCGIARPPESVYVFCLVLVVSLPSLPLGIAFNMRMCL
eukprot:m.650932 g.650932  ORF g.650932 m.650932 type:complete len:508 (+) comp58397_c0_seq42:1-1524(+)